MTSASHTLDLILNTVSASHDLNPYLDLLANKGVLVQLGCDLTPHTVQQLPLMFRSVLQSKVKQLRQIRFALGNFPLLDL